MLQLVKQPPKIVKNSVAGRVYPSVKKMIYQEAKKYNMTPSMLIGEVLSAWSRGETFVVEKKQLEKENKYLKNSNRIAESKSDVLKDAVSKYFRQLSNTDDEVNAHVRGLNKILKKLKNESNV